MRAKRLYLSIALLILTVVLLLPCRAEAAGSSLSGSTTIRAGSSVTLTYSVSGSSIYGVNAIISYDSSLLELTEVRPVIGWDHDTSGDGKTVAFWDGSLSNPINSASIFTVTFKVKSGVSAGTKVTVNISGTVQVPNESNPGSYKDDSSGSASWSATIAAPLSSNANLGSLTCGSGTLSPAFSSSTTTYSVTVPYSVTALSLNYSTQDSGARASVSGNSLSVGSNTVTITVTAPNGNTKKYVIYATRQQDPNYQPSSNASLASLSVSTGTLSPAFSSDVMNYVVYVPYETEHIDLSGVAQDGKARSVAGSSADLEPGDNVLSVVCTAEDGTTKAEYTVHVYRMPAYEGVLPVIIGGEPADYSAVDELLTKIPKDLTAYSDESVGALQAALDAVVRDYPAERQDEVDAMAAAIEAALGALEEKPEPEPEPEPEPDPTIWDKVLAVGTESVSIPYVEQFIGPLPAWIPAAVALGLLLLLFYLIGTLVGRAVGKRRTLRRLRKEQEAAQLEGEVVPVTPGTAGEEAWVLSVDSSVAAAEETVNSADAPAEETPAPKETTPEEPAAADPAAVEETPEAPVDVAPPVEDTIPEEQAEAVAPEARETETSEPVPQETHDPHPPAEEGADEDLRYMSLDDLLNDIRNM